MSYQDLHYLILKLLTRNFGLSKYDMALGVRVLGLEDKVSMYGFLLLEFVYLHCCNLQRVKGRFLLLVSFDFSLKRAEKLMITGLLNKFVNGGHYLVVTL